jgi:hypothetical protein
MIRVQFLLDQRAFEMPSGLSKKRPQRRYSAIKKNFSFVLSFFLVYLLIAQRFLSFICFSTQARQR